MLTYFVVSFALAGVALGSLKPYYDLADAEKHFENFITKYEKNYESTQEYNRRFEIFKNKLMMINHWNEIYAATFVVNEFTDKDQSERNVRYNSTIKLKLEHKHKLRVKRKFIDNAPEKLDYRSFGLVSRVKHQGHCNSCYIFSAVGNIEGQYAKLTGQLLSLSDQQALDCAGNPCSEGGFEYEVFSSLSRQKGLVTEAKYPYNVTNAKKHRCHAHKMRPEVKVLGGYSIDTPDEEALKGALYEYGPLSIGIYAAPTLEEYKGVTGVYDPLDCDPTEEVNHGVLLVGYSKDSNGTPYWIIKNSWGVGWGENGYLHMAMGKRLCSILKDGAVTVKVARA